MLHAREREKLPGEVPSSKEEEGIGRHVLASAPYSWMQPPGRREEPTLPDPHVTPKAALSDGAKSFLPENQPARADTFVQATVTE